MSGANKIDELVLYNVETTFVGGGKIRFLENLIILMKILII